ncbi:MAG TPA: DsbA family oxidoreductase [Chitinophagales bacterium]|nr:DsbA family oxidoreductase [Chitinophagales bacterium]
MGNTITLEIWSDIACPFCYIGKRKLEAALAEFPHRDKVDIHWKSFQLSPDLVTQPGLSIHEFLATHKGFSTEQAQQMNAQVTQMAAENGLTYQLDNIVVANTMKAHCFAHFAGQQGKQAEAEEALFRAYFTEGKNIDDIPTLLQIGTDIGLNIHHLEDNLRDGTLVDLVREDIYDAQQLGVRSVPCFVFNRKYAIAGAQDSSLFLQTLQKALDHPA